MHLLLLLAIIHLSSASLYFDLSASKPKCFIEDVLDKEAVIFLKWKIMPLSPISTQEKDTLLRNTLFYIYEDDTSKLVYQHVPTKEKSKTIFKAEKEGRYIRKERYCGSCERSFYVGDGLTVEDIKANFKHGILSLSIPKKDRKQIANNKYIAIEG